MEEVEFARSGGGVVFDDAAVADLRAEGRGESGYAGVVFGGEAVLEGGADVCGGIARAEGDDGPGDARAGEAGAERACVEGGVHECVEGGAAGSVGAGALGDGGAGRLPARDVRAAGGAVVRRAAGRAHAVAVVADGHKPAGVGVAARSDMVEEDAGALGFGDAEEQGAAQGNFFRALGLWHVGEVARVGRVEVRDGVAVAQLGEGQAAGHAAHEFVELVLSAEGLGFEPGEAVHARGGGGVEAHARHLAAQDGEGHRVGEAVGDVGGALRAAEVAPG